jgi:hypothetical protein
MMAYIVETAYPEAVHRFATMAEALAYVEDEMPYENDPSDYIREASE